MNGPKEHMMILDMIAEGKISPEEAEQLFKAMADMGTGGSDFAVPAPPQMPTPPTPPLPPQFPSSGQQSFKELVSALRDAGIDHLTVSDLQLVTRAARENDSLVGVLMVQRALVEPPMSIPQVAGMHVGLLQFLLAEVNRISAIAVTDAEVTAAAAAPLSRAAFVLAREYGWTPQQVSELTLGQVLLHLEMLAAEPV